MKSLTQIEVETVMYKLPELDTFEKIELIAILLDRAGNAHIDLDNGSDQVNAIYNLSLAKRVITELENEFIYMAI